jgi:hypothetical protein
MAITRGFAATVILAGLAVGTASAAWAETTMSGHYIETETDPSTGQPIIIGGQPVTNDWNVTPCGDGCANVNFTVGPPSQAHLVNGQWTMDTTATTVECADATRVDKAFTTHFTWDPNTLAGTSQNNYTKAACGNAAGTTQTIDIQLRQAP